MCDINIIKFINSSFGEIRATKIDGDLQFVGRDIARALGYINPSAAISAHVDPKDRNQEIWLNDSLGREQAYVLINRSGLFSLLRSCTLPRAKSIKKWISSEAVPSLQQEEEYNVKSAAEDALANPDLLIKALQTLQEERDKNKALTEEVTRKEALSYNDVADYRTKILGKWEDGPDELIIRDCATLASIIDNLLLKISVSCNAEGYVYKQLRDKGLLPDLDNPED